MTRTDEEIADAIADAQRFVNDDCTDPERKRAMRALLHQIQNLAKLQKEAERLHAAGQLSEHLLQVFGLEVRP
ncbi:hypothetical protein ACQR2B_30965 [Bradyrhizobium oligotrophicum]|uniref:hypothetical protein n=1 Tax=Bradyrhizobium TaxID=374 RepID=UPI003EBA77E5